MSFNLLPAALVMSIIVAIIAAVVLFYVQHLQKQAEAARYWGWAFVFIALRHCCNLLQHQAGFSMNLAADSLLFLYSVALWTGSRCFAGLSPRLTAMPWLMSALLAWLIVAHQFDWSFWIRELPVFAGAAFLLFLSAAHFKRQAAGQFQAGYSALALILSLKGLHLLDYPFLRTLDWFAPIGFAISSLFDGVMAALLLLASLLRQLHENQRDHQSLPKETELKLGFQTQVIEKQNRFQQIFESVPDALLICRQSDFLVLEVNQHWQSLSGLSASQTQAYAFDDLPVWRDKADIQTRLSHLFSAADTSPIELISSAHIRRHVRISASAFRADDTDYFLLVLQDVSDLIHAQHHQEIIQQRLSEREKLLSTVFQLIPDALTITELNSGKYVDANRHWGPMTGYTREQILGKTSMDIQIWGDLPQRARLIEAIQRDGEVQGMQIAFRHRDGRIQQCRVSGCRFEASGVDYLLLSSRIIDQEIAAENKLKESERKYLSLFQFAPMPLALLDFTEPLQVKLIEANDFLLDEFELAASELQGHTLDQIPRLARLSAYPKALELLRAHKQIQQLEVSIPDAHGKQRIYLLSAKVIDLSNTSLAIVTLLNITQQVQAEQEIRELSNQLEQRVQVRTLSLQKANAELAEAMTSLKYAQDELIRTEKMAALGSLVAGVAHELNTPIGNCVTVASTILDKTQEFNRMLECNQLRRSVLADYAASARTGMELLMRNLDTARNLLRSFKQVAVDQSSNQRRKFDLKVFLLELSVTLSPLYKSTPYQLEMELAENLLMDSYPGPLGQILTNFISNAIVHGFEQRKTGTMRLMSRELDAETVLLEFEDDGIGMSETVRRRVFDPFFTTKLGRGGSGLGMHITYNLVTGVLGGSINLESQPGQGTRFSLRLPKMAPAIGSEEDKGSELERS